MKLEIFAKLLRSHYVPTYAFPRIEPNEIWDFFQPGRIVKERLLKEESKTKRNILTLDVKAQHIIWNSLLKLKSFGDMNISISSEANDYMAHEIAGLLNLYWVRKFNNLEFKWTTPNFTFTKIDTKTQLVFIRSVLPIKEKLYEIRDIFNKHPNAVKVLILGGDINGIDYFDDFLKMPLHGAIHIEGTYEKLPTKYYTDNNIENKSLIPAFVMDINKIPELNIIKK